MYMHPEKREFHRVGDEYTNPYAADGRKQAWHFAGTMNHTRSKISGTQRLFTGDAGALKTPFNCHTSMPAAAAGILAAHGAMGVPVSALDGVVVDQHINAETPTVKELVSTYVWFFLFALYVVSDARGIVYKRPEGPTQSKVIQSRVIQAKWGQLIF